MTFHARSITKHAFAFPIALEADKIPSAAGTVDRLVISECLATRITVSSSVFQYGACIIASKSSMRPPYSQTLHLTNAQPNDMFWTISRPKTEAQEASSDVFSLETAAGHLEPRGSTTAKVLPHAVPHWPLHLTVVATAQTMPAGFPNPRFTEAKQTKVSESVLELSSPLRFQ
jgi:hypothetical protein